MIIILDNGRSEHYGVLCSGPQNSNSFKPLTSIWHPYETDPNFQMRKQGPWKLKRLAQGHRSGKWPRQDLKPQCEDTACDLLNHWAVLPPTEQHLGKCEVRAKVHTEVLLGPELDGCLLQDSSQLWVLEHFPKPKPETFLLHSLLHALCSVLSCSGLDGGVPSPRAYAPQVCWDFSPLLLRSSTCCQVHQSHHLTETQLVTLGFPPPPWSLSATTLLPPFLPYSLPEIFM